MKKHLQKACLALVICVISTDMAAQGLKLGELPANGTFQPTPMRTLRKLPAPPANGNASAPMRADGDTSEPEGTVTTYYMDFLDFFDGLGLMSNNHNTTSVLFGNDGKVYLPCPKSVNGMGGSLVGELGADGKTVTFANNQKIFEIADPESGATLPFYVKTCDDYGVPAEDTEPWTMTIDKDNGTMHMDKPVILGIFDIEPQYGSYAYFTDMSYATPAHFNTPTLMEYAYTDYNGKRYETATYICATDLGKAYIKALFPGSDTWFAATVSDDGSTYHVATAQVADNDFDIAAIWGTIDNLGYITNLNEGKLIYDKSDNTLKSQEGTYLIELYYSNNYGQPMIGMAYKDLVFSGVVPTGIEYATPENKEVAKTEYFDMAGRKTEILRKGLNIVKVTYTDGTTKTTKETR